MASIFISYNRESKAIATMLAADIEALGHKAWFDQQISGGRTWWDQILAQVRECDVFVFVMDPEALSSAACKREYGYAADLGKSILPVLISDEVSTDLLPPALSRIQFIDYRTQDRDAAFRLARALNTIPLSAALPEDPPAPPEMPISYLGSLVERVESATLSYEEQSVLVADLRRSLRDSANSEPTLRLLEKLRKRRDLFATFAEDVDELLQSEKRTPPAPLRSNEPEVEPDSWLSPLLVAITSASVWTGRIARKLLRRAIWPETRLGASLRGAIVGALFYGITVGVTSAIWLLQFTDSSILVVTLGFCALAGGTAGKSNKPTLAALTVFAIATVIGIVAAPAGFSSYKIGAIMVTGSIAASVLAFIIVLWQKVRVLRERHRHSGGVKPKDGEEKSSK